MKIIEKIFYGVILGAFLFLFTGCPSGPFWELNGNNGTNPSTNFLGTTNKQPLNIKTDNKTAIHIDTDGKVGIGTTSPNARLEVTGIGGKPIMQEGGQLSIMSSTYLFPLSYIPEVVDSHYFFMVLSSDPNNNGGLLFGQTKTIDGKSNAKYSALIDGKTNHWSFFGNVGIGPIDSTRYPTERLSVDGNICATGTIASGGTIKGKDITCSSSRTLKENIASLSKQDAVSTLMDLDPVTFYFKSDEQKDLHIGFIAEDVPDLVATSDRKGLSSMDIVAVLTKVVQQQQKKIEELEARFKDDK